MPLITTVTSLRATGFNQNWASTAAAHAIGLAFTFQGFVNVASGNLGTGRIFQYGDKFSIAVKNINASFYVISAMRDTANMQETPVGVTAQGSWVHVTATYDGSQILLYINGANQSVGSGIVGALPAEGATQVIIGQQSNSDPFFQGILSMTPVAYDAMISEYRLFNRCFTPTEVANTWNNLSNKVFRILDTMPNLFSVWPMNEGTGTQAGDQSGSPQQTSPHQNLVHNTATDLVWVNPPTGEPPEEDPSDPTQANRTETIDALDTGSVRVFVSTEEVITSSDSALPSVVLSLQETITATEGPGEEDLDADVLYYNLIPLVAQTLVTLYGYTMEDLEITPLSTIPYPAENITATDSGVAIASNAVYPFEDGITAQDSTIWFIPPFTQTENITASDSGVARITLVRSYSTAIEITERLNISSSTELQVMEFVAPPVLDAADPANPFAPSVYVNGSTLYENVITAIPGGPPALGMYNAVDWLGLIGDCDFYGYSINLSLTGGSFSITSRNPIGGVGQLKTIFGFNGIITYSACISGHGAKGWKTEGIFGDSRKLNQQILLSAQLPPLANYQGNLHQVYLQQPPTNQWKTAADCARAIANAANIDLHWAAPDAPLVDAFIETGLTVGDALRSLANRVGGILLWDGNTGWVVTTLDQGYGGWGAVPCHLVNPGGIECGNILDTRGRILFFPTTAAQNGNAVFKGFFQDLFPPAPLPPIIHLQSFRSALPTDAPEYPITLPGDTKGMTGVFPDSSVGLRYQILVAPGSGFAGTGVTSNRDEWTPLSCGIEKSTDGVYKALLTRSNFATGIDDGKFQLNVGYMRDIDAIDTANKQNFLAALQRQKLAAQAQMERIRFFKARQGRLDFSFFGTLPLPGNRTTISYDGCSMSGIVESVSASYPAQCSIQVGEYIKQTMDTARSLLDYYTATGIARPPGA